MQEFHTTPLWMKRRPAGKEAEDEDETEWIRVSCCLEDYTARVYVTGKVLYNCFDLIKKKSHIISPPSSHTSTLNHDLAG